MKNSTKHYEIFDYWKDKAINNNFEIIHISADCYRFEDCIHVVEDWGEPECWACGRYIVNEEIENEDLKKIWNHSKYLERCHIIGRQFGGTDGAENLFLLCSKCHEKSPDTTNPENFFAWVVNKRRSGGYIQEYIKMLKEAADIKEIDFEKLIKLVNSLDYEQISDVVKIAKKECGFHGFKISESSMSMSIIDAIKECQEVTGDRLNLS